MFSLVLLVLTPWLVFCSQQPTQPIQPTRPATTAPTTTPTQTTMPPMCTCPEGTTHCVDSVYVPGHCCPQCPNGENCRAEFIDFNGQARSEIISASAGVVDFGSVQCQCDFQNYADEPKASCVPMTTTPPPTTTPAMCTCSDGTQIPPGESHAISDCHSCYCNEFRLEAEEIIGDCFYTPCVDSVRIPGQCCRHCPNGENCRAKFTDNNGKARNEIISVSDGVVDFGSVQCECDNQYNYGEPEASCIHTITIPPPTKPAMCTCSDGTQVPPGETVWITDCRGCTCDKESLQAYEMVACCFMSPCVDSIKVPGKCCHQCPNGPNCVAEFIDDNGVKRREIISADGVAKFNSTECQCPQNYYGNPTVAICMQTLSIVYEAVEKVTP